MIISNGIKFTVEDAINYGLPIDEMDLESIDNEYQLEIESLRDEVEVLESVDNYGTCNQLESIVDKLRELNESDCEKLESICKLLDNVISELE